MCFSIAMGSFSKTASSLVKSFKPKSLSLSSSPTTTTKTKPKEINYTIDQIDFTDTYKILYTKRQNTYFLAINGMSPKIYHNLGHESSLNK